MQKADQLKAEISSIGDLLKTGRLDRAFKRATKAAKKWPKAAAFPRLAGLCAIQQQKFKLAQTYFERAWRLDPGSAELIQNYGLSLVQGGEADTALRFIDKIGARGPLAPAQQFIRAMALLREHQEEEALAAIEQVIEHQPGNLQAYCLKADILDELRQWERALEVLAAVVEQHPKFHYGQVRLAKAQAGVGRLDDALKHVRSALALVPGHPETLRFMVTLPNLSQDDLSALRTQISDSLDGQPKANREEAALIQFAAANLARRDKDTTREMHHLGEAHKLLRDGLQTWEDRREQDCRKRLDAPVPIASPEPRSDIPRPIFVVGLPRSGTTLVERILSAHSRVQGLGELASVQYWARKAEAQPSKGQEVPKLADYYVECLPDLTEDAAAFVDKAPGNYAYLGAIAQAFPNALILNVQRDPRDVALSMWREYFGARGLSFTHDLKWMAAEANRYRRYMLHWQTMLPGRIHDIRYEYLVNNLQDAVQDLARVCDLQFEDSMLSPQSSSDAVKTASSLQVRRPVNAASVGRWRIAADQLAPFVQGLDADLWPEVKEEAGDLRQ
ncbi:sulfotransferase [Rhodobacteraceae bacterium B1Z28]|uniref:Sulfotransferase n=1 Tax=Ruegeria haliotis TaxID=2747601 RepID=A0ABX2PPU1_9RHOB|nr:tetratricopeptide repeat-containing sulfotransferase family protein [Ruegeria haliotis]NVO56154.1 sulfotransferase [Ruegeria haliotis]